ncbi:hypothetical protein Tco_0704412 [Tanacetum coccineum]|uniref:Uncharacterized protein n=1 Tax=Tanacetum coccineum TaxID=301880 RepID=A0ABQ4Y2I1_9ASTR
MVLRPLGLISLRWSVTTATKGDNFARECRAPRKPRKQYRENTRSVPVETTTSNALISCDDLGWGVDDSEDEAESNPKIEKKTVKPDFAKIEFVKSKEQVKSPRKTTVKQGDQNSFDHLQYDCDHHQRQFNNKKMAKPV